MANIDSLTISSLDGEEGSASGPNHAGTMAANCYRTLLTFAIGHIFGVGKQLQFPVGLVFQHDPFPM
jgi:hypothetical protein